jgi:hypothetical protein
MEFRFAVGVLIGLKSAELGGSSSVPSKGKRLVQPDFGPQLSCPVRARDYLLGGQGDRGVRLTTELCLVPKLCSTCSWCDA